MRAASSIVLCSALCAFAASIAYAEELSIAREDIGRLQARVESPLSGACNVNNAQESQLVLLPTVGPGRAKAILMYRLKRPFRHVEDLLKVKGIGRKTLRKLRPYVTVTGPTTIARSGHGL